MALGVALLAIGCGRDNPGEPRTPAEELSAPNLGGVHVYCVELDAVLVTPCTVDLEADAGHSQTELRNWWLRAAKALRTAGTFNYKGAEWRFEEVFVDEPVSGGGRMDYGWSCRGDEQRSPERVWELMLRRNPGVAKGIKTLAAAHKRGCSFAPAPEFGD